MMQYVSPGGVSEIEQPTVLPGTCADDNMRYTLAFQNIIACSQELLNIRDILSNQVHDGNSSRHIEVGYVTDDICCSRQWI